MQTTVVNDSNDMVDSFEKRAFYEQLRGILAAISTQGYVPYRPWASVELDRVVKILESCEQ